MEQKDYLVEGMTDEEALDYIIGWVEDNHGETKEQWDDPELWVCVQQLRTLLEDYQELSFLVGKENSEEVDDG